MGFPDRRLVDEARRLHARLLELLEATPDESHARFDHLYWLVGRAQARLDRRLAAWLDAQLDEIKRIGAEARAFRAGFEGVA